MVEHQVGGRAGAPAPLVNQERAPGPAGGDRGQVRGPGPPDEGCPGATESDHARVRGAGGRGPDCLAKFEDPLAWSM